VSIESPDELEGWRVRARRAGRPRHRRTIHEEPSVPNSPDPDDATRLHEGLVITIEPILGAGGPGIREGGDGWTIRTADGAPAAHVEHTIVVTAGRPLVLTV
jgi:methionyl aminopeptidase